MVGGSHRDAHVTVGGRSCRCWHLSPSSPAGRGSRLQCTTARTASSAMSRSRCSWGSTMSSRGDWLGACRVATLIHPVLSQQRSAEGLSATETVTMLEHRRVPPRYLTNRMEQGTAMAHGTLDGKSRPISDRSILCATSCSSRPSRRGWLTGQERTPIRIAAGQGISLRRWRVNTAPVIRGWSDACCPPARIAAS